MTFVGIGKSCIMIAKLFSFYFNCRLLKFEMLFKEVSHMPRFPWLPHELIDEKKNTIGGCLPKEHRHCNCILKNSVTPTKAIQQGLTL